VAKSGNISSFVPSSFGARGDKERDQGEENPIIFSEKKEAGENIGGRADERVGVRRTWDHTNTKRGRRREGEEKKKT